MQTIEATTNDGLKGIQILDVPLPAPPGPHQVQVLMRAAGVNFFDLYTCMGLSPHCSPPCPLGLEGAGEVLLAGQGCPYEVGARVLVHCGTGGAFSEVLTVDEQHVMPLPSSLTYEVGACLTVSYMTAYLALHHAANLKPGGSVFIHSAAGSVGWAATQLARLVPRVTVLGTASQHKLQHIASNGVHHPICHEQNYASCVRQMAPEGVSVVLDCLAGPHFSTSQRLLAPFGKVVLVGAKDMISAAGPKEVQTEAVAPYDLIMKNIGVTGVHLNEFQKASPSLFREVWEEVVRLAAAGDVVPRIHRSYPLQDAREACRQLRDRLNVGKVVLTCSSAAHKTSL